MLQLTVYTGNAISSCAAALSQPALPEYGHPAPETSTDGMAKYNFRLTYARPSGSHERQPQEGKR